MSRTIEKPKIYIASCSFGKDSIATILLALENNEPLDRVVFSEVMFDHKKGISGEKPEHIEWVYNTAIRKLESMGIKVDVVKAKRDYVQLCNMVLQDGKNKGKKYGHQNCFPCYANSMLKVAPIESYISQLRRSYEVIQYVGIAINEPKRLLRLDGKTKISLLAKYGYSEKMALAKCEEYDLASPSYRGGEEGKLRGGCWFCYNAHISRYVNIRRDFPEYWRALMDLYHETSSKTFKYGKTLKQVEREMNAYEYMQQKQLKLF